MNKETTAAFQNTGIHALAAAVQNYGVFTGAFIRVSDGTAEVFGTAKTVWTMPGDSSYAKELENHLTAGDVLVVDAGGNTHLSCLTEEIVNAAERIGAAAILVNGAVDRYFITAMPVFAKSVHMKSIPAVGTGRWNVPVVCGGVSISEGDLLIGAEGGFIRIAPDETERMIRNICK